MCISSKHNYVLVVYWVFTAIRYNYMFRPLVVAIFRLHMKIIEKLYTICGVFIGCGEGVSVGHICI
jgi:hypothetical protein